VLVFGGGIAWHSRCPDPGTAGKKVYLVGARAFHRGTWRCSTRNVSDARLRSLHPDTENVRRAVNPYINSVDLFRSSQSGGLRRQLPGTVKRKPRYVLEDLSWAAWECVEACVYKDARFPDKFNLGLGRRKAGLYAFSASDNRWF